VCIKAATKPIANVLIESCANEDMRSFNSQDSPSVIEENVEVVVLDLEA
jgi:hypothetical protein